MCPLTRKVRENIPVKKVLLFQSALPAFMVIAYLVTLSFDPQFAASVAVFSAMIVMLVTAFSTPIEFVIAFTAVSGAVAAMSAVALDDITALAIVIPAASAMLCANVMQKELNPKRGGFQILLVSNLSWATAIGLAMYFGISIYGGIALFVAIALPLVLLAYESK